MLQLSHESLFVFARTELPHTLPHARHKKKPRGHWVCARKFPLKKKTLFILLGSAQPSSLCTNTHTHTHCSSGQPLVQRHLQKPAQPHTSDSHMPDWLIYWSECVAAAATTTAATLRCRLDGRCPPNSVSPNTHTRKPLRVAASSAESVPRTGGAACTCA